MEDKISQLELLSEGIGNEITELESLLQHSDNYLLKAKKKQVQATLENIISNLKGLNDSVYGVYEELNDVDIQEAEKKCGTMNEILNEKLSYDEKMYVNLKYGLDLY